MTPEVAPTSREVCWRCHRPKVVCWCADVVTVESPTRVVFIQHPREARVPVSTCRMAHRSLPGSELFITLNPEGSERLQALASTPGAAVLFPSDEAVDARELKEPPTTLFVVDGTWDNAKKLLFRSPLFAAMPKVRLQPSKPGNYRIRKEPKAHCLSTIEAVVEVLETCERAPGRYAPMLKAFDAMVDRQLEYIARQQGPSRHRHDKRDDGLSSAEGRVKDAADRLVLVATESNAWPRGQGPEGHAELIHLLGARGQATFEACLVPERELSPSAVRHLGVAPQRFLAGEARPAGLARWRAFAEGGVLTCWGRHTTDLMRAAGLPVEPVEDLKAVVSRVWPGRPGGVEDCALALGARLDSPSRAGRRLQALQVVAGAVIDGRLRRRAREWAQAPQGQ